MTIDLINLNVLCNLRQNQINAFNFMNAVVKIKPTLTIVKRTGE